MKPETDRDDMPALSRKLEEFKATAGPASELAAWVRGYMAGFRDGQDSVGRLQVTNLTDRG